MSKIEEIKNRLNKNEQGTEWWVLTRKSNGKVVEADKDRLCCHYEPEPDGDEKFVCVIKKSQYRTDVEFLLEEVEKLTNLSKLLENQVSNLNNLSKIQKMSSQLNTMNDLEKTAIEQVLKECGGDMTKASMRLGIGRSTLYRKIKQHGIIIYRAL
jgi:DNA-binding NtrC family response regulator